MTSLTMSPGAAPTTSPVVTAAKHAATRARYRPTAPAAASDSYRAEEKESSGGSSGEWSRWGSDSVPHARFQPIHPSALLGQSATDLQLQQRAPSPDSARAPQPQPRSTPPPSDRVAHRFGESSSFASPEDPVEESSLARRVRRAPAAEAEPLPSPETTQRRDKIAAAVARRSLTHPISVPQTLSADASPRTEPARHCFPARSAMDSLRDSRQSSADDEDGHGRNRSLDHSLLSSSSASAWPSPPPAFPRGVAAGGEQDGSVDLQDLLRPMDRSMEGLQAEIERLRGMLEGMPSVTPGSSPADIRSLSFANAPESEAEAEAEGPAEAQTAASASTKPSPALPGSRGMYTTRRNPDPLRAESWLTDPSSTLSLARKQVKQKELTVRQYVASCARFVALSLTRQALVSLASLRGSEAVRIAMRLPHVRDLLEGGCGLAVGVAESVWTSGWFSGVFDLLPGAGLAREVLRDEQVQALWASVPPFPLEAVQPWTTGPLRPVFEILARVPLSGLFFTLPKQHASTGTSTADALESHPLVGEMIARMQEQATVIALLQRDQRSMQLAMERMQHEAHLARLEAQRERDFQRQDASSSGVGLRNRRSNRVSIDASAATTALPTDESDVRSRASSASTPLSALSPAFPSYMTAALDSRLNAMHVESAQLRALAGSQESALQAKEDVIAQISAENEALQRRVLELEEQHAHKQD